MQPNLTHLSILNLKVWDMMGRRREEKMEDKKSNVNEKEDEL
jgi:hypothetical protein